MPAAELRVGIEGGVLARAQPTGVDRYSRSLLFALARRQPNWSLHVGLLRGTGSLAQPLASCPNVHSRRSLAPDRVYRALATRRVPVPFDLATRTGPSDVFFFPDFVVWPLARRAPSVAVVHDLSFLHHAEQADPRHAAYLTRQVEHSVRHARTILTPSETVRGEILQQYGLPEQRVLCVYPGVDLNVFRPRDVAGATAVLARLGLPPRFVLLSGTLEPRKNLIAAIDAYDQLPLQLRSEVALVVVGKVGWRSEEIMAALHRPRISGKVLHLGFTSDDDLAVIYSAAELLLFPSLYEGFGLPMLEAMASGTPVLAADRPIVAEVGAEAVVRVDTEDTAAFAGAIETLLADRDELARCSAAGRERAARFSWSAAADTFADVLRDAAG